VYCTIAVVVHWYCLGLILHGASSDLVPGTVQALWPPMATHAALTGAISQCLPGRKTYDGE
jgi:hypothetical protein